MLELAEIVTEAINVLAGLVIGVVTGFFFERRATLAARKENEKLKSELAALKDSVYNMRSVEPEKRQKTMSELESLLQKRAREIQDADGKILLSRLVSDFVCKGFSSSEVRAAIDVCQKSGTLKKDGKWLRVA